MTELRFGACKVVDELGSGALSTVYKAVQEPLGRVVAVKALKSTIATTSPFAAHLEREAHLLGELSHPNVALLFEFVKSDAAMYLVLEYVDGHSLAEYLARKPKSAAEVVAAVGAELARGLEHAHDRGIVHRDVKPANVLLSKRGEVKLVDFGIAQRDRLPSLDEPLERVDDAGAFGTPAYTSPEQILGEFVDARSDLFSLGVVLYQMLAGVRPFDGDDPNDRRAPAQRIRRDPPRPLRARAPDVPRALERVVMRLLEKLPADRFSSAGTVTDQLEDFVRASGKGSTRQVIARALVDAGLSSSKRAPRVLPDAGANAARAPLRPAVTGFAVLAGLVVIGGGAIQWSERDARDAARVGDGALELLPAHAGHLRAVASPWADVAIDGQHVDTTPFARTIPLAPGTHYVTFTHPEAPPEKRVVKVAPDESVFLDVTMNVSSAKSVASAAAPPSLDAAAAAAAANAKRDDVAREGSGHAP